MIWPPRLTAFFNSIKGKIFSLFAVTFLTACGLTLMNFSNLAVVRDSLLLGERYGDLLNDILEVRRYEKNVLFYGDAQSLTEGLEYLSRLEVALDDLGPDIASVAGKGKLRLFQDSLAEYKVFMQGLAEKRATAQEGIRTPGKVLVDLAEEFSRTKRERIHQTILRASLLPFAYLAIFVGFMLVLIKVIANSLLRPLSTVQQLTGRFAHGDFRPFAVPGQHIREISGLLEALNRMAKELEANQEDLLQARKIAALGTFTAGIAHEINNPINNIMLTAELLLEMHGDTLDDDGREMTQDIMAQAERAGDIVRNLLDFSRTERPVFSRLSPAEIIRSTVALAKNQVFIAGLNLEQHLDEDLPQVDGNLRSLQQVFLNLLLNAVQATPRDGRIVVSGRREDGIVRLEVRDTGIGIRPEDLPHVFEPFFTTKEVGQGTGLGLAMVYSIVRRHGGKVEVHSTPGQGTTFAVLLPVAGTIPATGPELDAADGAGGDDISSPTGGPAGSSGADHG